MMIYILIIFGAFAIAALLGIYLEHIKAIRSGYKPAKFESVCEGDFVYHRVYGTGKVTFACRKMLDDHAQFTVYFPEFNKHADYNVQGQSTESNDSEDKVYRSKKDYESTFNTVKVIPKHKLINNENNSTRTN